MDLQCDKLFNFLFLDAFEPFNTSSTSLLESSILFLNVLLTSPDLIKFFAVFRATFFADFLILLPIGVLAVLLSIEGADLIMVLPIGSSVLSKELKIPPIPLPF